MIPFLFLFPFLLSDSMIPFFFLFPFLLSSSMIPFLFLFPFLLPKSIIPFPSSFLLSFSHFFSFLPHFPQLFSSPTNKSFSFLLSLFPLFLLPIPRFFSPNFPFSPFHRKGYEQITSILFLFFTIFSCTNSPQVKRMIEKQQQKI